MKKLFQNIKTFNKTPWRKHELIFLALLFSFSFLIRYIGLKHGFPLLTHPDEEAIIFPVYRMTKLNTLNPGNFNRPNQILYYLNFIYLNFVSFIAYGKSFSSAYHDHVLNFYFHARLLISVFGSFIPVIAYKIGKEFKIAFGFAASLVFAFFPLFIKHSLYITPDVPITFFSLSVIYFTLRYLKSDAKGYWLLALIFSAINTAEKYPGLLSVGIVLGGIAIKTFTNNQATLKENIRSFLNSSLKTIIIFIFILFIIAPFLFIEFPSVIDSVINEARTTHLGADNLGWYGNMLFYFQVFFSSMNFFGLIFFMIGIVSLVRSRDKNYLVLLFGFFYWAAISILPLHWERWGLPMFTAPLFLIAKGISTLWMKRRIHFVINYLSISLITLFVFIQGVNSFYIPVRMQFTDTRFISKFYCDENGITQNNSIYEGQTPLRPMYTKELFLDYQNNLQDNKFIILSSFMYNRFFSEPDRYQEQVRVYNEIRDNNILLEKFEPEPENEKVTDHIETILYYFRYQMGLTDEIRSKGPTIEIYKISD